jgi:hypothetical protein
MLILVRTNEDSHYEDRMHPPPRSVSQRFPNQTALT